VVPPGGAVKRAAPAPAPRRRVRASTLVLLSALPFVVLLFATTENYRRALAFILPGIAVTIGATVAAYLAAGVLGLGLAALLALRAGPATWWRTGVVALVAGVGALVAFTRPAEVYVLVGDAEAGPRVAFVQGTPQGLADRLRSGRWGDADDGAPVLTIRAVDSAETALARLAEGQVATAFVPVASAPAGVPELWRAEFLPPGVARTAVALATLALITGALAIASRWSAQHPLTIFAEMYVDALRGVPMLVVILYVGFPLQGALRELSGGAIDMSRMTRGVVALALGYAAYMAEIFRAGIEAVPRGQVEAARSLGLDGWQTARHVVLPQALRIVVPPLGNEFIAMLKDTALLSILSVRDITQRAREFQASSFLTFPPYNTVAILYIGLTLAASSLVKWVERRTSWGR
jgi:polar amino acid transport system permease protein